MNCVQTNSRGYCQSTAPCVDRCKYMPAERTYEELFEAARKQRQEWYDQGEKPNGDAFVVTPRERLLILDRRPPCYELSSARDRIFGFPITVLRPGNGDTSK